MGLRLILLRSGVSESVYADLGGCDCPDPLFLPKEIFEGTWYRPELQPEA
jgi:hypothetical protein